MWRANKTPPSVPVRASRGQGPGPQIQADSPDSVFSAKHKRVKFILGQCQLPSAALSLMGQAFGECREDISCIISCSSRAVSFWPCSRYASVLSQYPPASWRFNASFCRSLMLHLSVCVSFSELYLFSSVFSLRFSHRTLTVSSWQQQGHVAGCLGLLFLPLLSRRRARCRPYTHFLTTRSRGSVFCCSWTALSKSLSFTLSVCAARLTKTQTAFFQPEVLVLAIVASPWPPYYLRTHTLISNPLSETPNISFWRQGWEGESRGGKKRYSIFWKQTTAALTSAV